MAKRKPAKSKAAQSERSKQALAREEALPKQEAKELGIPEFVPFIDPIDLDGPFDPYLCPNPAYENINGLAYLENTPRYEPQQVLANWELYACHYGRHVMHPEFYVPFWFNGMTRLLALYIDRNTRIDAAPLSDFIIHLTPRLRAVVDATQMLGKYKAACETVWRVRELINANREMPPNAAQPATVGNNPTFHTAEPEHANTANVLAYFSRATLKTTDNVDLAAALAAERAKPDDEQDTDTAVAMKTLKCDRKTARTKLSAHYMRIGRQLSKADRA